MPVGIDHLALTDPISGWIGQEELDQKLAERQARETGICAVREHLYQQGFDELIRQITLDGPERGLLLLRVRDEVRMTIDALKTLYNSR